ncbi:MAG: AAA family ATPase [Bacteroidales bacterium]|jgi:predicted AAA+ superfamily ATPase|nr:AAA family ATPase [Bacteroidales bacterium]
MIQQSIIQRIIGIQKKEMFYSGVGFMREILQNIPLITSYALIVSGNRHCEKSTLFFDEIQVVSGWELYNRLRLDEEFRITVTVSNASPFSSKLGTKLTGKHRSKELFPFSILDTAPKRKKLYYFNKNKAECNFIIMKNNTI